MEKDKVLWHGSEELLHELWKHFKNANQLAKTTGLCRATCQRFLNGGLVRWTTAGIIANVASVSGPCLFDEYGRSEDSYW